jgi:hypothetical protein
MITYNLKRIYRVLVGIYLWLTQYKKRVPSENTKIVYFNLNHNKFERYIYLFVKFFLIEGYTVYIKRNFSFIGNLEKYSIKLLNEEGVIIHNGKPKLNFLLQFSSVRADNYIELSFDYFSKPNDTTIKSYHIPMSMHPDIYYLSIWQKNESAVRRYRSVFFAGNFDKNFYDTITQTGKFNLMSRLHIYEILKTHKSTVIPLTPSEFKENLTDGKIFVVDKENFSVPIEKMRDTLSKFSFFMACPGVSMPFSHNIIEAMSCSCIPIIEKGYAVLFQPPLVHLKTALVFDGKDLNLQDTLNIAVNMSDEDINDLSQNVRNYYNRNLTPSAVIKAIFDCRPDIVYLNAEAHSVSLLNK